jgi:hypothetical protein
VLSLPSGCFAAEVFFVVVADVRTGHVLVLHASDALTDFFALHASDVTEHALVAEVFLGQIVGRQRGRVVGRQRDQVVEDAGFAGCIGLEGADLLVSFFASSVLSYSTLISWLRS